MDKTSSFFLLLLTVSIIVYGCIQKPDFSEVPELEFVGFSKTTMNQGTVNNDSTTLIVNFTDGDGDIGFASDVFETNLTVVDNRTGNLYSNFKIPAIPEQGANNGVSGEMRILLLNTCCTFPDGIPPCESPEEYPTNELTFDIYMVDRAGNMSNVITTSPITLLCN